MAEDTPEGAPMASWGLQGADQEGHRALAAGTKKQELTPQWPGKFLSSGYYTGTLE